MFNHISSLPEDETSDESSFESIQLETSDLSYDSTDLLSQSSSLLPLNVQENIIVSPLLPLFSVLSFRETFKNLWVAAAPFCASRLAVSVQGMGYAYLMGQFGHTAIASGPLITGFQNAVVTPLRTGLGAINVLVPSMQNPKHVGRLVQQSYISTVALALPSLAILWNAGALLKAMGTDDMVAESVQSYMNGYIWGLLPIYGLVIDQQFSLAIGKRGLATLIGLAYASCVLGSGYLLTTYGPDELHKNTYGLGLGFSISAWAMSLMLKFVFMLQPDFSQYRLFSLHHVFKAATRNLRQMLSVFTPMWLQSLSESFNLMIISILISRMSNEALMAEQVSLQWMMALSPVILAIANVTCSMTSRLYGALAQQHTMSHPQTPTAILSQFGQQTRASLLLAGSIGVIFASLFLSIPTTLTNVLIPANDDNQTVGGYQVIESLSATMLQTNSIGLWVDSLRMTLISNLLGMRDASIPAGISFLLISGLGLLIGAVATELFDFGANTLFIVRNTFLIAATVAIAARWFVYQADLAAQYAPTAIRSLPETHARQTHIHLTTHTPKLVQYGSFFHGNHSINACDDDIEVLNAGLFQGRQHVQ